MLHSRKLLMASLRAFLTIPQSRLYRVTITEIQHHQRLTLYPQWLLAITWLRLYLGTTMSGAIRAVLLIWYNLLQVKVYKKLHIRILRRGEAILLFPM